MLIKSVAALFVGIALAMVMKYRSPPALSAPNAARPSRVTTAPQCSDRKGETPDLSGVPHADPSAPDYDPIYLIREGRINAPQTFAREPRVVAWAKEMEPFFSGLVKERLRKTTPGARFVAIECRTSSCQVLVEADAATMLEAIKVLQGSPRLAPATGRKLRGEENQKRQQDFYYFFDPPNRAPKALEQWIARMQKRAEQRLTNQR